MESAFGEPPEPSKLDAQDAVKIINDMIWTSMAISEARDNGRLTPLVEKYEVLKRQLTDYLLAIDPRPGKYFKGPND